LSLFFTKPSLPKTTGDRYGRLEKIKREIKIIDLLKE